MTKDELIKEINTAVNHAKIGYGETDGIIESIIRSCEKYFNPQRVDADKELLATVKSLAETVSKLAK